MPIATNQRFANNEIEIQLFFNIAPSRHAEHPSISKKFSKIEKKNC